MAWACLVLAATMTVPAMATDSARVLDRERPIDVDLDVDPVHLAIDLPAQTYAWIQVRQVDVDIEVTVLGPAGAVLDTVDFETEPGRDESIEIVTRDAGRHRLRLRPVQEGGAGRVRVRLGDQRPARPNDPALIEAERRYNEAVGLARQRTDATSEHAASLYRDALAGFIRAGDVVGEAKTQNNLGVVLRRQGDATGAIELYRAALERWRQLNDERGEIDTLLNVAAAHRQLGQFEQAIRFGELAVARSREVRPRAVPRMLDSLAQTLTAAGDPDRALALFRASMDLRRASGSARAVARSNANLGYLLRRIGDYQAALNHLHEALTAFEQTHDDRQRLAVLNNLGTAYDALGQYERAVVYLTAAQALSRQLGDAAAATAIEINLGWARHFAGDPAAAIQHFETALDNVGTHHIETRARLYANLGRSLLAVGELSRGRAELFRARRLARAAHAPRIEGWAAVELGQIEWRLGHDDAASAAWTQALDIARRARDPRTEAAALFSLAHRARARNDWATAQRHLEASIDVLESLRASAAGDRHRATFLASKRAHYDALIDLLLTRHDLDPNGGWATAALVASEQARARSLGDVLAGAIELGTSAPDNVAARLRALERRVRTLESQRERALDDLDHTPNLASIESAIETTLADAERLRARLVDTEPDRPTGLDVATLQQQLDTDTALVVISLGPQRSALWLVTPEDLKVHRLPPGDDLETLARRASTAVTARGARPAGESLAQRGARLDTADRTWNDAARALSDILLAPIARDVPRRLAVVAGGSLATVPFAALPVPNADGVPLITRHEVIRLPSASVLPLLRQPRTGSPTANHSGGTLAVIADPVLGDDDPRLASVTDDTNHAAPPSSAGTANGLGATTRGRDFARLPFAAEEAASIVALFEETPDAGVLLATGFDATRDLVTHGGLTGYRYLHFATHGIIDARFPERSALVLSLRDAHGAPQDGFLRLADVFRLRLDADLVVLSACETALGEVISGEGLVGLARGFFYAGTPRVVASLWAVQDQATQALMTRFYTALRSDEARPAAALRQAQLALWRLDHYRPPYFWAGFELQGDWR